MGFPAPPRASRRSSASRSSAPPSTRLRRALKSGRTRVVAEIERFEDTEVVLIDGTRLRPDAVICATGYRRGLEPIVGHLGVLRRDGIPAHYDGAPEHPAAPRLYFSGFWGSNSGQIRLMPIHARRIARAAARDRARAGTPMSLGAHDGQPWEEATVRDPPEAPD